MNQKAIFLVTCLLFSTIFWGAVLSASSFDNWNNRMFLSEKLSSKGVGQKQPLPRDKWALIVGLNSFLDPAIPQVQYGLRNATELSKTLIDPLFGRFAPDHVLTLAGAKATKEGIEKAILNSWLAKNALPNDLVVLYLCTRTVGDKTDQTETYLCAYDTTLADKTNTGIGLVALLKEVKLRLQAKQIICLLDTSPVVSKEDNINNLRSVEQLVKASGVTIFSANELNKPSYESSTFGGSYFLHNVLQALKSGMGRVPLSLVANQTISSVQEEVEKDQNRLQAPLLVKASDNYEIENAVLGIEVKSSVPPDKINIGHPVDLLAYKRPDLSVRRSNMASSTGEKLQLEEDDEESAPSQPVDFGSYMAKMKRTIQEKWQPQKGFESRKVITTFVILQDGSIVNPTIVEGSGIEAVDKTALDALKAASPLDPLPLGAPKSVQIRYQFDWRVTRN